MALILPWEGGEAVEEPSTYSQSPGGYPASPPGHPSAGHRATAVMGLNGRCKE